MQKIKNIIRIPFILMFGFLITVICAHYEFSKYLWKNK